MPEDTNRKMRSIVAAVGGEQNYLYWAGSALLALSAFVRILFYPTITSDYTYFLSKWFTTLAEHPGLTAFRDPFSDYAPLYLYFLKLLTYIPVPSLYSIKTLSVLFDLALAVITYFLLQKTAPLVYAPAQRFFAAAVVFATPTILINSALWAQSDAIYATGILLCLYFVIGDRPLAAALAFAGAFSIKFQAIFFLPILLGYLLRKESTAGYLLLIPVIFFISVIPARLAGGSLGALLFVYAHQSAEYTGLSISAQNVFALLGTYHPPANLESIFFWMGVGLAGLCAVALAWCMYYFKRLRARQVVLLSLVCCTLLPYLLPRMHERYFYLADILSVVYALYNPKQWYVPVLVVGASLASYMPYLSGQVSWLSGVHLSLIYPSLVLLCVIGLLLAQCYTRYRAGMFEIFEATATEVVVS